MQGTRLFFHGKGSHINWRFVRPGDLLWKTADPALDKYLHGTWCNFDRHAATAPGELLEIHFEGRLGGQLSATCRGITVGSGQPLEPAEKRPLTAEVIEAQFARLGGTGFTLGKCTCNLEEGLMLPISILNKMRRELVEKLPQSSSPAHRAVTWQGWSHPFPPLAPAKGYKLSVLCREPGQAYAAADAGIKRIYLDFKNIRSYEEVTKNIRQNHIDTRIWIATMRIMKPHEAGYFKYITAAAPDGVLVRNLGAAYWFRNKGIPMVGDFSLNTANPESVAAWQNFGMKALTVSYDLNAAQLADLLASGCGPSMELTLHQHIPMFHTEHCVFCTFLSQGHSFKDCGQPCDHHKVRIMDRAHAMHYLRSDEGCRNTMFNGQAQSAARYVDGMRRCGLNRFRLELLDETAEKTTELIEHYRSLLKGQTTAEQLMQQLNLLDRIGVTDMK